MTVEFDEYGLPIGDELPPSSRDDDAKYRPTPETVELRKAAVRREWSEKTRRERAGVMRPDDWLPPAVRSGDVTLERHLAGFFGSEHSY